MNEVNEIKIPKGVGRIAVKQHDDKIVIEFIPEKTSFKDGDFVYEDGRIMIVKSYPNMYHAIVWHTHSDRTKYDGTYAVNFSEPTFRHATEEERQILIDAMIKDGKHWNSEKLEIEYIPQPRFKAGDKVQIKDGISSETHRYLSPNFIESMDKFIGKELTVKGHSSYGRVFFNEGDYGYYFHEDWLEPYTDEPQKGDLAIFWDDYGRAYAIIRLYNRKDNEYHCDNSGNLWSNAIKFESKEQYERILKGED